MNKEQCMEASISQKYLRLTGFPKHQEKLSTIATHYHISLSVALQLCLAYVEGIYSVPKTVNSYSKVMGENVWTPFSKKKLIELETFLKEEEADYAELARHCIREFHKRLVSGTLNERHDAFITYLSR